MQWAAREDAEGVFQLRGTTEDTPMPEGAVGHRLCVPAGETRSFGEIVFPGPGVYIYEVNRRNNPEGITARDSSVYRVTVVVRSDGDVQQVIETDGEKVTEIRYEDRYEKAALVETGDVKSLFLPGAGFSRRVGGVVLSKEESPKTKEGLHAHPCRYAASFYPVHNRCGRATYGATKDLRVTYDRFQELPENYAKITGLPLQEAEITTTNGNIHKYNGYVGNNQTEKRDFVAYYGAVKFGTRNRNDTSNAVTKANEVKGNITLRWRNRAVLSDNTKADVKVVVSGWTFSLGKIRIQRLGMTQRCTCQFFSPQDEQQSHGAVHRFPAHEVQREQRNHGQFVGGSLHHHEVQCEDSNPSVGNGCAGGRSEISAAALRVPGFGCGGYHHRQREECGGTV